MNKHDLFFKSIGIKKDSDLKNISKAIGIPVDQLRYYNNNNILPSKTELTKIDKVLKVSEIELMLTMGIFNPETKKLISDNSKFLVEKFKPEVVKENKTRLPKFKTQFGKLYKGDCIDVMRDIKDDSVDLIFADPPFNLNKLYPSKMDDDLGSLDYIEWTELWIEECIRILKPGGSFFLWNIPKWNSYFARFLNDRLFFKHWIAADIKLSLPIKGKLYPSHYSLLFYTKGPKANFFQPDRMPMETCPRCYTDLKDYGGYKDKMNPSGVNISDIWTDIPPVRHTKYKKRQGANELSVKLLDRIIEMSSKPGDLIFDPFGGSGTTYAVAEAKRRRWVGVELGPIDGIIERLNTISEDTDLIQTYRKNYNTLFTEKVKNRRKQLDLWTDDTFRHQKVDSV